MAKLQRLQDRYSQYFSMSIRILNSADLKPLTGESNGNPCCLANREACPAVCERYIRRSIDARPNDVLFSICPFGLVSAIAPLGLSKGGLSSGETEFCLIAIDNSAHRLNRDQCGTPTEIEGNEFSDKIEVEEKARLIVSAFDLFFASRSEREDTGFEDSSLADSGELGNLTKREQEILRLVCMGMSNRQVADELLISEHTVKLHVSKILRKLNLSNRTQMAVYGMRALR